MNDDPDIDERDLDDEPDELALFVQQGPGLFDDPLPIPEPACDIAAAAGELPAQSGESDELEANSWVETEPDDELPVVEPDLPVVEADLPVAEPDLPVAEPELLAPPVATATKPDARPVAPLALYRRYRPDTFAEVIGQEHVTEPLGRAIENNKVNHAYLFSGPRGCGKTTSARILARCLNCAEGPTPTPCGVCESCLQLATGGPGSIDVIEIDAASHGRVDDARELREGVYFAPVASRYKIYIIDEAHMVTKEGFNALLKVVEEPPEHVKFIFATTEPEKVIGTIRSRTHHYPFRLVPPRVLSSYLERICTDEGIDVERSVLPLVVRAGAGSVRDSLSVLDQLLGAADRGQVSYAQAAGLLGYTPDALLDEIVDAFAAGDGKGVFATVDKVIEVGQDPRRFAEDLLERMRDLVIVAQVPEAIDSGLIDVAADQAERLRTQAAALGAGELTRAAEVIATGLVQMRGTTAPRLHLELICARVLLPTADADGRGLHARLDRLERRLDMPDVVPGRSAAGAESRAEQAVVRPDEPAPGWDDLPPEPDWEPPQPQTIGRPAAQSFADQNLAEQNPVNQRPGQHQPKQQRRADARTERRPASAQPAQKQPAQQHPVPDRPPQQDRAQAGRHGSAAVAATPAEPAVAAVGGPDTADVRRLWPQILDEVKSRKRFTHALLSQNAHVVEVRGAELLLGFANQGTLEHFQSGGSVDVLHACLLEVLGADLRISASVDGGPPQQGRQTQDPQPSQQARQQSEPAPPTTSASPVRRPAPAVAVATAGQGAAEAEVSDMVNPDDEVLDESGADAVELLARQLGAQIIDEEEN